MNALRKIKKVLVQAAALCLVFALCVPVAASAAGISTTGASVTRASDYLTAYNTYVCNEEGDIQVWYEVIGTGYMDEIGVLSIILYEVKSDGTLTRVKTFLHENYSSMLSYNDTYIYSHVSYAGSASKTYKAYVCIWAGKDGDGDTRYMWAT